MKAIKALRKV